jgi:hypothetical protein
MAVKANSWNPTVGPFRALPTAVFDIVSVDYRIFIFDGGTAACIAEYFFNQPVQWHKEGCTVASRQADDILQQRVYVSFHFASAGGKTLYTLSAIALAVELT